MTLLRLMFEFFKTGLFSVGGGLATLPFLYEMSDKTGWFSHADIADMIAISESTPGAIGINMSTYAGFQTAGVPGALLASLSLAAPSVVIILIIAATGITGRLSLAYPVLLTVVLAAAAPSAVSVAQLAELHGGDSERAGVINVMSTLLCIITIPLMIGLYQILCG